MDWTPSDSKYLKSKRSDISLVGGVSGVSLANEPMDSAPLPHPHAREEGALSRLGGGDGGAEDGEERVGGRGTSTYVMNVMATTSHSQSSTAIASKSKDSVEKKKVSRQLLCLIIMIIMYFLFHVGKLHSVSPREALVSALEFEPLSICRMVLFTTKLLRETLHCFDRLDLWLHSFLLFESF
jgi:hypothetical protein